MSRPIIELQQYVTHGQSTDLPDPNNPVSKLQAMAECNITWTRARPQQVESMGFIARRDSEDDRSSFIISPLSKSYPPAKEGKSLGRSYDKPKISDEKTARWREPVLSRVDESDRPTTEHTRVCVGGAVF